MYTAFFALKNKAFDMTPDPAFLFMTPQHREALAGLTYGILDRKGFLVLSGSAGTGKTTLLAWLLDKLPIAKVRTSVVVNPMLTPNEFLEMVLLDFGIEEIPQSKAQRLHLLKGFLLKIQADGNIAALIIDEAHKLSPELLEEIRLLGNFEQPGGKLLQILLAGQSELDDVLAAEELWQLKQRVSVRLQIGPMDRPTLEYYIRHRWTKAGGTEEIPFPAESLDRIFEWSQGIPRLINSVCDNALALAFADNSSTVTLAHVDEAGKDLRLPMPAKAVAAVVEAPKPAASAQPSTAVPAAGAPTADINPAEPLRRVAPVTSLGIATLDRYQPAPVKTSLFVKWVSKLGLA